MINIHTKEYSNWVDLATLPLFRSRETKYECLSFLQEISLAFCTVIIYWPFQVPFLYQSPLFAKKSMLILTHTYYKQIWIVHEYIVETFEKNWQFPLVSYGQSLDFRPQVCLKISFRKTKHCTVWFV